MIVYSTCQVLETQSKKDNSCAQGSHSLAGEAGDCTSAAY